MSALSRAQRKTLETVAGHRVVRHIHGGTILVYKASRTATSSVRANTLDALEKAGLVQTIRSTTMHYHYALTGAGRALLETS